MKYPEKYTNPREYILNTFGGDEYIVDSANRLVVPFPDGTKDIITSQSLCNGGSTTYTSSEESDGTSSTNPSSISTGTITSKLFIGDYLALDGVNGIITIGIPKTGLVGNNPYMLFESDGIYGMYGDTDQPWFVVSMAEATYTYIDPDTLTQSTKTFQGGDFFIGNYETAYLYWEYATHKLTIAGDVIIAGDLESANFTAGPPVVGYKLVYDGVDGGSAYFGGAVISGSSIIGSGSTTANTIGSSIDTSGNFINDLINSRLNTSSKKILADFVISDDNTSASGFKTGNITWNSSGVVTGGTGVAMTPYGFVGANSGSTTFSISSITGNAVFSGDITGSAITGSTITGGIVQTDSIGDRIVMNGSTNSLDFNNFNNLYAKIKPYTLYQAGSPIGYGVNIETGGNYSTAPAQLSIWEEVGSTYSSIESDFISLYGQIFSMSIIPLAGNTYSLGINSYRFSDVHTNAITLNGVQRTSWPTAFSGNLSDLYINTAKNWGSYNITNLGSLIPGSGTTTLGNSSYYWSSMYIYEMYGVSGANSVHFKNDLEMNNLSVLDIGFLDVNGNCDIEGVVDINSYLTVHGITTCKGKLYSEAGLDMNWNKIERVAYPTSSGDAATMGWVEDNFVAK